MGSRQGFVRTVSPLRVLPSACCGPRGSIVARSASGCPAAPACEPSAACTPGAGPVAKSWEFVPGTGGRRTLRRGCRTSQRLGLRSHVARSAADDDRSGFFSTTVFSRMHRAMGGVMWGGPPFGTGPQQFGGHFDVRGAVGADVGREKRRRGSEMDRGRNPCSVQQAASFKRRERGRGGRGGRRQRVKLAGDLTGRSGGVPDAADRYRTIVAFSNAAGSYRTPKYHCSRSGGFWIARSGRGISGRQRGFASKGQVPALIRFVAFGCHRSLRRGPVSNKPGLRPRQGTGNHQITQTSFWAAAVVCLGASPSRFPLVRAWRIRAASLRKGLCRCLWRC